MNTKFDDNISKPEREPTFPLAKIKVGGGLVVKPSEGETLEQVAAKTRNAVAGFKKIHKDFNLSVITEPEHNHVLVYRNPLESDCFGLS